MPRACTSGSTAWDTTQTSSACDRSTPTSTGTASAPGLASRIGRPSLPVRRRNTPDEETAMTYDNAAIVRHAYHTAEGSVLDVAGFVGSFANDGVINLGHAGVEPSGVGKESYRGDHLGDLVPLIAKFLPDVHRELHRVNVLGD